MNIDKIDSVVQNIIQYKYRINNNNKLVNVSYGIDDNYGRCAATSIASICINNLDYDFNFYIIAAGLSERTKNNIKLLAKSFSINIIIYEIDKKFFEKLPIKAHIPISTYFRLILPILLKDSVDKLYYIDADVVCLKNAGKLFDFELKDNIVAAVPDINRIANNRIKILKLKKHIYFNAGVLVINVKKWNEFNILDKCLNILRDNPEIFTYQDQDALNVILTGKIKYLDRKFNCINIYDMDSFEDIILLHFANQPKPWNKLWYLNIMCNKFTKNIYSHYEKKTAWKDYKLIDNNKIKDILKWYLKKVLFKLNMI